MGSVDNFRERFEALEQQTEQLKHQTQALEAHTCTVERRLRRWRGMAYGMMMPALFNLSLPSGKAVKPRRKHRHDRLCWLSQKRAEKHSASRRPRLPTYRWCKPAQKLHQFLSSGLPYSGMAFSPQCPGSVPF